MENVAGEQGLALQQLFPYKSSYSLKIQAVSVIKSHSLMMGASNLAILIFLTCFFHFWHLLTYNP